LRPRRNAMCFVEQDSTPQDAQSLYQKHIRLGATPEQAQTVVRAVMASRNPSNFISQGYGAEGGDIGVDQGVEDRTAQQFPYYANTIANGQNSFFEQIRPLASVLGAAAVGGYAAGGSAGAGAGAGSAGGSAGAAGGTAGASSAEYLAAADAAGGMAPAYGTSGGYSAGIGAGTGSAGVATAAPTASTAVAPSASSAGSSLMNKDAFQVGSTLASGYLQSQGAKDAAKQAAQATASADATQRYFYDTTRADNMPALDTRNAALVKMRELLGIAPASASGAPAVSPTAALEATPGYQFRLKTGADQLTGAMNARGMRNSGAMLKETTRFGQDFASNEYDKEINRLSVAGGMGQTGATVISNAGQNAGNNISNNALSLGTARADNALAQGNIYSGTLNNLAGWWANKNGG
jgi:hypothetical protein